MRRRWSDSVALLFEIAEIQNKVVPSGGGDVAEMTPQGIARSRPRLRVPQRRAVPRQDSRHGPLLRLEEPRYCRPQPSHFLGDDALQVQYGGALSLERQPRRIDRGQGLVDLREQ